MCGRYTLTSTDGLTEELGVAVAEPPEASEWWRPRFNIAPTQPAPVVLVRDGERRLELMRWGLIPPWADSPAIGARMINARAETLDAKPAFRDAVKHRRCLIPADGFFEWKLRGSGRSTKKIPVYLRPVPRRLVAFAGLWERWRAPDGHWVTSFTIVTGPPNELVAPLHDRMPVVITRDHVDAWLAPGPLPHDALTSLLAVPPVADWQAAEVSPRVNSPAPDDPELIEPVASPVEPPDPDDDPGGAPTGPKQLTLF